jgi:hypothetical protein
MKLKDIIYNFLDFFGIEYEETQNKHRNINDFFENENSNNVTRELDFTEQTATPSTTKKDNPMSKLFVDEDDDEHEQKVDYVDNSVEMTPNTKKLNNESLKLMLNDLKSVDQNTINKMPDFKEAYNKLYNHFTTEFIPIEESISDKNMRDNQ